MTEGPYELPKGWEWATFGEIVELSKEKLDPLAIDEMPYIGLEHIEKDTGRLLTYGSSREVKSSKTRFYRGDLLYGKLRPYLNKVHVADFNGICSTDILVFSKSPYISSKFQLYRLLCSDFVSYASNNVSGIQYPRVNFKTLSQFEISLPPLSEQHRIVTTVETLLAQVNASQEKLVPVSETMKRFRQSVLVAACSGWLTEEWGKAHPDVEPAAELLERIAEERKRRYEEEKRKNKAEGQRMPKKPTNLDPVVMDSHDLEEIPENWVWVKLGSICKTTSGGTPARNKKEYYNGDIPWLKSGELEDNIIITTKETITEEGLESSSAKFFPKGTLLIALYGATVGKTGMLAIESTTNQAMCGIYDYQDIFEPNYLWKFLISFRTGFIQQSFGGAQPNISQGIVRDLSIPLPPLLEQHEIVRQVGALFRRADEMEKQVIAASANSERITQSILTKAFRGELVSQDPDDEPASVLLERIKADKKKQKKRR